MRPALPGQRCVATIVPLLWIKTTPSACPGGPGGGDGRMGCTRDIGGATSGHTVVIVVVHYQGQNFTTSISFTPR